MGELVKIEKNELINALHRDDLPAIKPFQRQIFLLNTHIAGMSYQEYQGDILSDLESGKRLKLQREPENPFDELAIIIFDDKDRKIGYVPRVRNPVIARLMDAGKLIYAVADQPEERFYGWRIDIYMED